jgi:hypothetical protein
VPTFLVLSQHLIHQPHHLRHKFRCRAKMNFIEVPGIGRFRQPQKDSPRWPWLLLEHGYKAGYRLH